MPDALRLTTAVSGSAILSALVVWTCAWPWRMPRPAWTKAGLVAGAGTGFFLGCWLLRCLPHWPPREDLDRLLTVVIPAVLLVELLAVFPQVPRWIVWPLRVAVVGGGARALLHGTSYLAGFTETGSGEWSPVQTWLILGALACAQGALWLMLSMLAKRAPGLSHTACLAGTIAGAAVTIMLSGYATGGQVGLPLAASLLGAAGATLVLPPSLQVPPSTGVAVVGLSSLLVIGRFFGQLTITHMVLLFFAPVLGWLPELALPQRVRPRLRALARVALVGLLVSGVVIHAQRKFAEASGASADSGLEEPSIEDSMRSGR